MLKTEAEILVSEVSDLMIKAMLRGETTSTLAHKSVEEMELEKETWGIVEKLGEFIIKAAEEADRIKAIEEKLDTIDNKLDILFERSKTTDRDKA